MIDDVTLPAAEDSSIEFAGCERHSDARNKKAFRCFFRRDSCPAVAVLHRLRREFSFAWQQKRKVP
jgi:hypothetical protein